MIFTFVATTRYVLESSSFMTIKNFIRLLFILILAGCGSNATPTPAPTIEPAVLPTHEATEEVIDSPGKVLFEQFQEAVGFACVTCHYVQSDNRLLGPGLLNIEQRFEEYDVEAESLEAYMHESILSPAAFIVPADPPFPANIMPRTYGDVFTDEEIDEIITYILSF